MDNEKIDPNQNSTMDYKNYLNTKSKSFCGAKWYNATIWLGNGATASCHHPPAHKIDPEEIKKDPSALHNTTYKKLVRKQMQEGIQTKECEYCWKIENLDSNLVSDRVYKSAEYDKESLDTAFNSDWKQNFSLKTLEIAFDNNCNFACSYCNAGFSTKWAHDINMNGPYNNLESDGWGAYAHNGSWAQPYGVKNSDNPYTEAFWKWWDLELSKSLKQLRITGGEATVSHDFWKLIEWYENNLHTTVELAINTNLGIKKNSLDRLCKLSQNNQNISIFTSNESVGLHSEYIRSGLIWDEWKENVEYILENGNFKNLHIMMTVNALCLKSFDKIHEYMIELRKKYKDKNTNITCSHNILRFPSFQSITTLPSSVRQERALYLENWLEKNSSHLYSHEIDGFNRTISYIKEISEGHSVRSYSDFSLRAGDFYNFYNQYDKRRNLNIQESFNDWPEMLEWYNSLSHNTNKRDINTLVNGDATEWGQPIFDDVMEQAKNEKLI